MNRTARLTITCAALLQLPASAHWTTHGHLPRWAQRGAMRSCVAPFDGLRLRPWLDVDPLACRFNVVFTSPVGWESELIRTADVAKLYLKPRDGHLFFWFFATSCG